MFTELKKALATTGLILRGGLHDERDAGPRTVILIGNTGKAMWQHFEVYLRAHPEKRHPLDDWIKSVITPIAAEFNASAVFPSDRPYAPFQTWAAQSEDIAPSPLGLMIHPEYGLWHAWRAALLFEGHLPLPARRNSPSPCGACAAKPCLTTCPVGAFSKDGFDVNSCATYLETPDGKTCLNHGCQARNACPEGQSYMYQQAQMKFHMAQFQKSRIEE